MESVNQAFYTETLSISQRQANLEKDYDKQQNKKLKTNFIVKCWHKDFV